MDLYCPDCSEHIPMRCWNKIYQVAHCPACGTFLQYDEQGNTFCREIPDGMTTATVNEAIEIKVEQPGEPNLVVIYMILGVLATIFIVMILNVMFQLSVIVNILMMVIVAVGTFQIINQLDLRAAVRHVITIRIEKDAVHFIRGSYPGITYTRQEVDYFFDRHDALRVRLKSGISPVIMLDLNPEQRIYLAHMLNHCDPAHDHIKLPKRKR